MMFNPLILIPIIAVIIILGIIASGYVKAPPDTAYVISGFHKEPRILIGTAGVKIPFFERMDKLLLKQVTIDVKTEDYIPTLDFINIKVDAVVKVRVSTEPDMIKLAMRNFLNKKDEQIVKDLQDSLQGNMKEIIGAMTLKDINNNRDAFGNEVQNKAQVDMKKLGVEIISCNIQNVIDRNGLIEDMGMDNTAKIKKEAAIAKAEADRDIAIAQALADKDANDARVKAQAEIAEKNNELSIKQSELKKVSDSKKAEADAAYSIQQQQQRKTVETATINADIARQEREVELKARQAEVTEKALDAQVRKKAEAEKYAELQKADAELYKRQKEAQARQFEQEREAEAKKAKAEAELVVMQREADGIRARGEAEAAAVQAKALAEAAAIQAKALAEAEGIQAKALAEAEGMEKKAEAYQKYNNAAMAEMLISVLPEIAGRIADPLQQIDKITIIGGGDNNGVANIAGNVPAVMAKLFETMKETTGIDLADIVKADTYDAKVTRNLTISTDGDNAEDAKMIAAAAAAAESVQEQ